LRASPNARRPAPPAATASAGAHVNSGGFSAAVNGSLRIGHLVGDDPGAVAMQHAMLPVLAFAAIGLIGGFATPDDRPGRTLRRPSVV
jgi:hypothetical protein